MILELIVNGVVGLGGAFIGAKASMNATKLEMENQENNLLKEQEEKRENASSMIETFLINEIEFNINNIKFLEKYFEKGYNNINSTVHLSRPLKFDEYSNIKYTLLETNTIKSKKTIEIYQMFYMVSQLYGIKEKLGDFTENEFNYIVHRYNLAKNMVGDYYEKKYEHFI